MYRYVYITQYVYAMITYVQVCVRHDNLCIGMCTSLGVIN